ncbi:MAG: FAD-binding protein, partial [Porticoccaceae bacterium]|nr:FAD-binding protein [Porticoccaceae bacterium]MBT6798700.1 FAD-binding protein [Porticoccaceae bacterium]
MSKGESVDRRRAIKRTVALGVSMGTLGAMNSGPLRANEFESIKTAIKPSNPIADLVIVGAGNAGIPAAIQAADLGFKVLLVDKNPFIGGMLNISGGHISGADSKLQIEKGIEDSPALHYRDAMR